MNTFKKTIVAIAAASTLAVAAAPAYAGPPAWQKPFVKGLGFGVGLGIAGAIFQPRPQTIVVQQQPVCGQYPVRNAYGQVVGYQTICQ
ncbi:hypothetical protein [Salaquimonas pukyongi]|uniref:hypothetical protein n=1 Tax=Salaquimonas pukyongi TaxID=2712698 RepID=UPI00096B85D8|nr:hypothetical protein [Salaquimonas pukyongi]